MEKELNIQTQFLQEGMVLARDVETEDILLLTKDTKLTQKMITHLFNNNIRDVWVYDEVKTENFKIYRQNFIKFDNLVKLIIDNKPIDMDEVEDILDNFNNTHFHCSLLRYIHGIRKVDNYTYQHSLNLCYLAMMLGKWAGFENVRNIALAGLLHDIGKVMIPKEILNKPDALTEEEWNIMRKHSYLGYEILLKNPELDKEVLAGVLYHHERMDGSGYPQGLQGERIPEVARVVAIVDVFDALTSDRVYRDKRDVFEVMQYIHDRYTEFDLKLLKIFTENMLDILVGEEVLLTNDQVGKIVFNNPFRPFAPLIQTDEGFVDLSERTDIKVARVW